MENNQEVKFETPIGKVTGVAREMTGQPILTKGHFAVVLDKGQWLKIDSLHSSVSDLSITPDHPGWVLVRSFDSQFGGAWYKIV